MEIKGLIFWYNVGLAIIARIQVNEQRKLGFLSIYPAALGSSRNLLTSVSAACRSSSSLRIFLRVAHKSGQFALFVTFASAVLLVNSSRQSKLYRESCFRTHCLAPRVQLPRVILRQRDRFSTRLSKVPYRTTVPKSIRPSVGSNELWRLFHCWMGKISMHCPTLVNPTTSSKCLSQLRHHAMWWQHSL